ncbi:hypothetical protein QQG55_50525 [Brugia pahangi]
MKSTVSANETGVEGRIQEEEEEEEYKKLGEKGETTYMEASVSPSAGTGLPGLGLSMTPFSINESSVSMKSTVSANETGIEERIQEEEEEMKRLGEKGETTYMEASVSPSAGTGLPGLGLSMTPFSIPESSVSMKSTVSANETGIEGRIQEEEEEQEYKKLGEKGETTYMEASVSPSAGTGLPGLGLSMTPFSIPESSVSMKSTVSANETGVEGRIQEEEEEEEYKKLGEKGETTYLEASVSPSAGTGLPGLGLSMTPFSIPESSVSMKSTVSANETGIEGRIQEEEEEEEYKKLGEKGETTYMEASVSPSAGTGLPGLGLSMTPFSIPESSVWMTSTVSANETGVEGRIQEEEEEEEYKKLGEKGETTYMEASVSPSAGTGLPGLGLSMTPFSMPESSVSMKSTVSANETGIEERIQEEEEEMKRLGEKGETTYMEASVSPSAGTGLPGLGLSMTPFSIPESSVSMKSTVSANETGIEGRIQEEEEEQEYKKLGEKGETTYMEASVSPSAGTGLPGLGLSMTPFSIPESSVSMKSTVSANETGIEGRIQEEEEEMKRLGEKGETTYMEASVSPSAGTGLPGLGLSMTPFSIPESSVSMKSTVSANETGIEGRIQEEEEEEEYKKLGEKGETTYMEASVSPSAGTGLPGLGLSMTPFSIPESSVSMKSTVSANETGVEGRIQEEEEEEEYKKLGEKGETTYMEASVSPSAGTGLPSLGLSMTPFSIPESSVSMKSTVSANETGVEGRIQEEEEEEEYKKLGEKGETTYMEASVSPSAGTGVPGLGLSMTPFSMPESSVWMKSTVSANETGTEERVQEEEEEMKRLGEKGETTYMEASVSPSTGTGLPGLGLSMTPFSIPESSVSMKSTVSANETGIEGRIQEEEEEEEYKKLGEKGETTYMEASVSPSAGTGLPGLGLSMTPFSIPESSVSMKSTVSANKTGIEGRIQEEEEEEEYKKLGEKGETTYMEASVSPSTGTGLPGLGLSMTPFSIPESSVSMKSTVSANETGTEGRIQEEEEEMKRLGEKGETTYMEASVSPSAGTGLPGLGLSMTPFSVPESSVSMKSTVSANETGIEGRIQEEEEEEEYKKLGEKGETTYMEASVSPSVGTGLPGLGLSMTPFSIPESSVSMKSTVSANETGVEGRIQEEEEEEEYKKLGEKGETTYMEASVSPSAGTGLPSLGLSMTPFSIPESSVSMKSTVSANETGVEGRIQEEEEEEEYKKLGEKGETTYMEASVSPSAGTGLPGLGLSMTPFSIPESSVSMKSTVSANETGIEGRIQEEEEEQEYKKLGEKGETTYMEASVSPSTGTGLPGLGLSMTPFSMPESSVSMKSTVSANETGIEERIQEEEEEMKRLGEKRETTYMEASVSPSAGTGLPGLGLSMTPFSIPESSVSMKSTVSANETGIEGRIQEEEEEQEYKKLGEKGETTYMEASVSPSAGTGLPGLGLSMTPFSIPESSVSMKSTVSANKTGIEGRIQEEEEEEEYKKLGEKGETTYMEEATETLSAPAVQLGVALSVTPFLKPDSSSSPLVLMTKPEVEEKLEEEKEEEGLEYKRLLERGETTVMDEEIQKLPPARTKHVGLGISVTPHSMLETSSLPSVLIKKPEIPHGKLHEEKLGEEKEEEGLEYKKLLERGETTVMDEEIQKLPPARTKHVGLGISITPHSMLETSSLPSVLVKKPEVPHEKLDEEKLEEEGLEYKKFLERGETTVMDEEIQKLPPARTKHVGLGISVTPHSMLETSSLPSVLIKKPEIPHGKLHEEKLGEEKEEEGLEYKKLLERGETTVMDEEIQKLPPARTKHVGLGISVTPHSMLETSSLLSVLVKKPEVPHEKLDEEKLEEEGLEYKKLLERGETTVMDEEIQKLPPARTKHVGLGILVTPHSMLETSSLPSVLVKKPEVPHEKLDEERLEEEGLEYKKLLERGETTVMDEEIQKLPPARTKHVGLGISVTPHSMLETSSLPSVLVKKPEVPHEKLDEEKLEEEGLEYKKLLERGETTVMDEEIQKLPPARTKHVGLGISVTPHSMLETSSLPSVLVKKPEVPHEKLDEEKLEEEGLEYKKLLERGETTVMDEEIQKLPPARTKHVGLGISVTPHSMLETSSSPVLMRRPEVPYETESRYATEEILSSSEIASKQVKFEDKRLDIANKTDSSDIYIRTRFSTSTPNVSVVEATSSSIEETSAVTELVDEIKQGWLEAMKSLELLRKHLQDFERNIRKAAQLRAKMASRQGRGNRKNRKADITNIFSSDKGKNGHEHIVQPMDNEKEMEKLLSASLDVDNSTKNHGKLENEMNLNGTESTIGLKFRELSSHINVESKKIVENSWRKSALRQTENLIRNRKLITNNPSEMRRKMLEEQMHEALVRMENGKRDEQGEIEVKSKKEKEEEEDRVINGTVYTRLMEEKARLEEARLLREEQAELRKKQELNHGFADKAQLERQDQIAQKLEQLIENERQHREQLEREERMMNANMRHHMITPALGSPLATLIPKAEEDLVLSTQCSVIRKFVRVFDINDAIEWIHMNCPIAKIYFPEESCEQVEKLFKSCLQ